MRNRHAGASLVRCKYVFSIHLRTNTADNVNVAAAKATPPRRMRADPTIAASFYQHKTMRRRNGDRIHHYPFTICASIANMLVSRYRTATSTTTTLQICVRLSYNDRFNRRSSNVHNCAERKKKNKREYAFKADDERRPPETVVH